MNYCTTLEGCEEWEAGLERKCRAIVFCAKRLILGCHWPATWRKKNSLAPGPKRLGTPGIGTDYWVAYTVLLNHVWRKKMTPSSSSHHRKFKMQKNAHTRAMLPGFSKWFCRWTKKCWLCGVNRKMHPLRDFFALQICIYTFSFYRKHPLNDLLLFFDRWSPCLKNNCVLNLFPFVIKKCLQYHGE